MSRRLLVLTLAVLAQPVALFAQETEPPAVRIHVVPDTLDTSAAGDSLTVGDAVWVTVQTSGPGGHYLLPETLVEAYGEHPELAVLESARQDGQLRLRVALFRPGSFVLPIIEAGVATADGDTLRVPVYADTIHVASVLAPGDTLLADIKPLWISGGIPLWFWILLALLIALALLAWWWWRRRGQIDELPQVGPDDAYQIARRQLEALKMEPPTSGRRIAAAAQIGEAVRVYLTDGWAVPARERTTFELLPMLPEDWQPIRPALASLLSAIDLVKFARLAPEPGEVPRLASAGLECVDRLEQTRQAPEIPEAEEAAS
jgi:hypothetical protein